MYDYYVVTTNPEEPRGRFAPWDDFVKKFAYDPKGTPFFNMLVPNVDTVRFRLHAREVDRGGQEPVLFTGGTGVGKSVIIVDYLAKHAEEKDLVPVVISFSAQTPRTTRRDLIESKLEKKRKTKLGAPPAKRSSSSWTTSTCPRARRTARSRPSSSSGSSSTGRLLRPQEALLEGRQDTTLEIAACGAARRRAQAVTPRFFATNGRERPAAVQREHEDHLEQHLGGFLALPGGFPGDIWRCGKPVVDASVDIYFQHARGPEADARQVALHVQPARRLQGRAGHADDEARRPVKTQGDPRAPLGARVHARLLRPAHRRRGPDYYKNMVVEVAQEKLSDAPTFEDLFETARFCSATSPRWAEPREERKYEEVGTWRRWCC